MKIEQLRETQEWTNPWNLTPFQRMFLISLIKTGKSAWYLAGHWWYGQPLKGVSKRFKAPEKPPFMDRLYQASHDPELTVLQRNKAALLCSYLLWSWVFPEDIKERLGSTATEIFQKNGLQQVNDIGAWLDTHSLNNSHLYAWVFDMRSLDVLRLTEYPERNMDIVQGVLGWPEKNSLKSPMPKTK